MYKYFMTCNIYNNMFCEEIAVIAETLTEAMNITKEEVFRNFGASENDFFITRVRCEEADLGLLLYQNVKSYKGFDKVKKYIDMGADVNYRFEPDEFDFRPLHMASYYGDMREIKMLIEAGCEMNPLDINGRTPLDHAIQRHNEANVVEYLLIHGAKRGAELQKTVEETINEAAFRSQAFDTGKSNDLENVKE